MKKEIAMWTKPENWGIFCGEDSVKNYLNPAHINHLPLIELPATLNPFKKTGVDIFASLAYANPCQNIKFFSAWHMLEIAKLKGKLDGVHTIVASSSGNFVLALAMMSKTFGVENVKPIVPSDTPSAKLDILRLCGAPAELVKSGAIAKAEEYGRQEGFLHLNQYNDLANSEAYKKYYGPLVWNQVRESINIWCSGLGTGGTTIGMSQYLKSRSSGVFVLGVIVESNHAIPGVRTDERLKETDLLWEDHIDYRIKVETKESFKTSLRLFNLAEISAGPSSGFALAGLLKFLELKRIEGKLDNFRQKNGKITAVFCCPDTLPPYADKYTTHLDAVDI